MCVTWPILPYSTSTEKKRGGKVAIENPTAIDVYVYILQNGAI